MISGLKYSFHNEHKKRSFAKEWGFANLGNPMHILGGVGLYTRNTNGFDRSTFTTFNVG